MRPERKIELRPEDCANPVAAQILRDRKFEDEASKPKFKSVPVPDISKYEPNIHSDWNPFHSRP